MLRVRRFPIEGTVLYLLTTGPRKNIAVPDRVALSLRRFYPVDRTTGASFPDR